MTVISERKETIELRLLSYLENKEDASKLQNNSDIRKSGRISQPVLRRQSWRFRGARKTSLQGKVLQRRQLHRERPPEIFSRSPLKALDKY